MENGTEYADDSLRVDGQTTPDDVRTFVEGRIEDPVVLQRDDGGVTVWDFANHVPHMESLERMKDDLTDDQYVIPFQMTEYWPYMMRLLPKDIRESPYLVWSHEQHRYRVHRNIMAEAKLNIDAQFRSRMERTIQEGWHDF